MLGAMGVPVGDCTPRRKMRVAKAFMAVAGVRPGVSWSQANASSNSKPLTSRQVIAFVNKHLGEAIADSSYDDIRRKDLVLPVEALIVMKSAANPDANTNDGTRGYAINPEAANAIRTFRTSAWTTALQSFLGGRVTLAQELSRARGLSKIPVSLPGGRTLIFGPGAHNQIQKRVIEEFLPIFGFGAEVLYVGDTDNRSLLSEQERLKDLKVFELAHDKLPDVVAYSKLKHWIYLIEVVTTANPITELRRKMLLQLTQKCDAGIILVTAFADRDTYRRHARDIAWETEVWIAHAPEHLIHFNGDKFLGPYSV